MVGILDASPWKSAGISGPDGCGHHGKRYLKVDAQGYARKQGITEYQWESAEPMFDEFTSGDFIQRFPAGE